MPLPMRRVDMTVGSVEWARSTIDYAKALWQHVENSEDRWRNILKELEEGRAWQPLGYRSLDALLRDSVGCTAAESIEQLGERQAGPGRGNKIKHLVTQGVLYGTRAYWVARLKRDEKTNPHIAQLLADVRARRISANAAATQLGWKRTKSPLEQLQHWYRKASAAEKRSFEKWLCIPVVPKRRTRTTGTTGTTGDD